MLESVLPLYYQFNQGQPTPAKPKEIMTTILKIEKNTTEVQVLSVVATQKTQVKVTDGESTWTVKFKHMDGTYFQVSELVSLCEEILADYDLYCGTKNETNFHKGTFANFITCERPNCEPDFQSDSNSAYWYTPEGVVRESNHWLGCIKTCNWGLDGFYENDGEFKCGFCKFEDFAPNTGNFAVAERIEKLTAKKAWAEAILAQI